MYSKAYYQVKLKTVDEIPEALGKLNLLNPNKKRLPFETTERHNAVGEPTYVILYVGYTDGKLDDDD